MNAKRGRGGGPGQFRDYPGYFCSSRSPILPSSWTQHLDSTSTTSGTTTTNPSRIQAPQFLRWSPTPQSTPVQVPLEDV